MHSTKVPWREVREMSLLPHPTHLVIASRCPGEASGPGEMTALPNTLLGVPLPITPKHGSPVKDSSIDCFEREDDADDPILGSRLTIAPPVVVNVASLDSSSTYLE
jgi:hypothetical protein